MENTTTRLIGEDLQLAKRSERMVGSSLRKSERKFSQKSEKKRTRNGEVLNQSPKQLEASKKPNSPTN